MEQPTIVQVIKSVFAAFIGVQSRENRERDFTQGKLSHYVIAGIFAVGLFIGMLVFIVSVIL